LLQAIQGQVTAMIYKVEIQQSMATSANQPMRLNRDETVGGGLSGGNQTGRNDPCPCGSGKKYKKCRK